MSAVQLQFLFACLDFPGRDTVTVWEIAAKLGYTSQHVLDHVDDGRLMAINSALKMSRRNLRVPIDEYRRWVLSLLTTQDRRKFLEELPDATLREVVREGMAILARRTARPDSDAILFPSTTATKSPNAVGGISAISGTRG